MSLTNIDQKIETALGKLWDNLLSHKQFYAFEFLQNQKIGNIELDFYCPEAFFGIRIEDQLEAKAIQKRNREKKTLEASGYKFLILSTDEVLDDYEETVCFLDREFTTHTRFQCG